jgi:hypothetical protein
MNLINFQFLYYKIILIFNQKQIENLIKTNNFRKFLIIFYLN